MKIDFSASSLWSETCFAVPSRENSVCDPSIESDSSLLADPWTKTYCNAAVISSSPSNVNGSAYGAGPSASCLLSNDLWNVNGSTCIASEQHITYKYRIQSCFTSFWEGSVSLFSLAGRALPYELLLPKHPSCLSHSLSSVAHHFLSRVSPAHLP